MDVSSLQVMNSTAEPFIHKAIVMGTKEKNVGSESFQFLFGLLQGSTVQPCYFGGACISLFSSLLMEVRTRNKQNSIRSHHYIIPLKCVCDLRRFTYCGDNLSVAQSVSD